MRRRTALEAIGASILAGTAVATTASATGGPRIVELESEIDTGDPDAGDKYAVEYLGDGRVELTGSTTVPKSCYEAEVVGIESTQYGDVVRVKPVQTGDLCLDVVSRLQFRIELAYDDDAEDVFLEFLEEGGR
ncbi:hypothetical protein [Natrarchaeobius chitinivorans]|uniref:Uncharacterized protein n=1 Tax=Natrarchaeobius chitinivorans TaxID=1679083 RepID=A0A3N6LYN7_NATCH|nr:hypothetical protein [Natrarchaeobius chitinivorans]RQG95958.1 hypothetical protein EA473_07190 [Natrarchaeobius chitinivorans]